MFLLDTGRPHFSQKLSEYGLVIEDVTHDVLGLHVDQRVYICGELVVNEASYGCVF